MKTRLQVFILISLLSIVLPLSSGCGTSAYNALMDERIAQLKREAPYAALQAPTEIPGSTVKIAIPKVLTRYATLDTPDPTSPGGKISPERVKINRQLNLPGVYCVYDDGEGAEMTDGFKAPMACQIAIIPKSAPEAAALPAMLDAGVKLLLPGAQAGFEPVDAMSPDGKTKIPWKVLHVEGDIMFDLYPKDTNAAMKFEKRPAVGEVWWHESEHFHTLLFWRATKELDDKAHLMDLAKLAAGTISVAPPAVEAKPDGEAAPADKAPAK